MSTTDTSTASRRSFSHRFTDLLTELRSNALRRVRHSRVHIGCSELNAYLVEVPISTLRAELARWIQRAREGEEIVVTDRGTPVARLLPVDSAPLLEQLVQRGVLSRPKRADRPAARGATRVRATGPVADLVSEQRS